MVRTTEPYLSKKRKDKKQKPAYMFKENKRRARALTPYIYIPYAERLETQVASSLETTRKYKLKVREGSTAKMRAKHRTYKRDALRGYNKKMGNMRTCTDCGVSRAISDFDYQKDSIHPKTQRRPYCYICRRRKNAEAYQRRRNL